MDESTPTTLQLILKATEELIAELGCKQTTMQEIIQRSGISKGGIYHYVQTKDELFSWILLEKVKEIDQEFFLAVQQCSLEERLEAPVRSIIRGLNKRNQVMRQIFIYLLSLQDQPSFAEILASVHRTLLQTSIRWILTGQQAGVIPSSIDPCRASNMLIALFYGNVVQKTMTLQTEEQLSQDEIFRFIYQLLGGKE